MVYSFNDLRKTHFHALCSNRFIRELLERFGTSSQLEIEFESLMVFIREGFFVADLEDMTLGRQWDIRPLEPGR